MNEQASEKKDKPKEAEKKTVPQFVCTIRCVYHGRRYKSGEILVTDASDVPSEYFKPVR